MPPNTAPATPPAADETGTAEPRSAAEHCAAAEALFARAREIYPTLSSRAVDQDEYRRCFDWARMHLRLAESITAGAGLVLAHRQLLAGDVRLHNTYVSYETQEWTEFLGDRHDTTRRSA
ncbi:MULTISPECIES: hypothetical protein [Amycolatopsis]|uniref:Uncharacterized protein n=2 Tax=Amycolatopsis TaxID=1813 RepID=A0A2N3WEZ2_9PSEU|nr:MULTISPECIES: hypothetical protein [Amycolatopsis]MBB2505962.1 hypothetical protein [Amycolatopsis echigonensis]PKV92450.1 hypothetical protein ATK30_3254 [Amycolatopsis niigatensis]TVT16779.1 hypothetical protein FNH06_34080 [Amycolatopsis acidiphila]UIJ59636.1 hypothetical protein LWP59_37400 [Amycolatopsis acidiphila]GHG81030.1 hypothetical protein GCM10017788_50610 [Amycolatopsis acidiphila]